MKTKGFKRIAACMLAAVYTLSYITVFADKTDIDVLTALKSTSKYVYETVSEPQNGSIGGEWAVIGLQRSSEDIPGEYFDGYFKRLTDKLEECGGVLHEKKYTEYSRTALAVAAIGGDPTNVAGYNLLLPLSDYKKTVWQGVNGAIWALIAFDSRNYDIPDNRTGAEKTTRELLIDKIIGMQNADGGFSLTENSESDPDVTAMSLTALAPYRDTKNISGNIEKGLAALSLMQSENGGFISSGKENCESAAQVLIALSTLGISAEDERFTKNGNSVYDALMSFYSGGGFKHVKEDNEVNQMSTEQALCALDSYYRFLNGKNPIYNMTDRIGTSLTPGKSEENKTGSAIKKSEIIFKGKTFEDISESKSRQAIEALAERGIISGKTENEFNPSDKMTRAEFAAISVRALGMSESKEPCFEDVLSSDWFFGYIGAAYKSGIVNGVSEKQFNPQGTITRAEALTMLARAARLCGLEFSDSSGEARDLLAVYYDYAELPEWAQLPAAMCVKYKILDSEEQEIKPSEEITREEIAQMIYNMLLACKLI